MAANPPEYQRLIDEARKQHLANIQDVGEKVKELYRKAADELAEKAANAPPGSITEHWAKEY